MTEKLFKMFKTVKYDIAWVRMFMHMVTDPDYDIDPRLQKVLLQKIESMYLEQVRSGNNNYDAEKHRIIYQSKVYEKTQYSTIVMPQDEKLR